MNVRSTNRAHEPGSKHLGLYPDGTADVRCWCDFMDVRVPLTDVRRGVTRACWRPRCRRMAP